MEFDFESNTGDLFFNYVFASEEYNEFVHNTTIDGKEFNDVFGFFLDGKNIALIPRTNIPVSIETVNGGGPVLGMDPSFPEFYNNNDPSEGGVLPFEYDGFTDVFIAHALGLTAGKHHIKLVIADTSDPLLDSAVFIQAGSFSATNAAVPEPCTFALLAGGLLLGNLVKRKLWTK